MRYLKLSLLIFVTIFFISCGVSQHHYRKVESKLAKKDYKGAATVIKKAKQSEYGKKNRLLYYMNLGWTYHLAGDSKTAQAVFTEADSSIGELFTKKTSDDVASFIGNDNNLPFRGEDFEKIMLTIIRALDYAFVGDGEDARVEIRKVEDRINFLNDERSKKATYSKDAFAYYLSGLIYELDEEYNHAFVAYKKAYNAYKYYAKKYKVKVPIFVKKSFKRFVGEYGNTTDTNIAERELKSVTATPTDKYKKMGQFVFVHYNGYAPKKLSKRYVIHPKKYGRSDLTNQIHMAYPVFVKRKHRVKYAQVKVNGKTYRTDIVQPIEKIAIIDLKERMGRIWKKMVLRRIAKYVASSALQGKKKKKNTLTLGDIAHIASNLSEQADLRSWRVLPAEIGMVPIDLEPGSYDIEVTFHTHRGATVEKHIFKGVKIEPSKKVFKWYRTIK